MAKTPEKSDGAFRTIREVADWLGVPTHVLRFWESKFEQIAPVKGAGGRRYYRPEDMRLLGGIKVMLHDQGLTIRAVSQKIDDDGVEPVMALSPEMDMPEGPPARTRRVIRHGEESDSSRVVAFDAKRTNGDGSPPMPSPAKEPVVAVEDTLPAQPDAPQDPMPSAPAPAKAEVAEAPAPTIDETAAPDVTPDPEAESAPTDPEETIESAPEPAVTDTTSAPAKPEEAAPNEAEPESETADTSAAEEESAAADPTPAPAATKRLTKLSAPSTDVPEDDPAPEPPTTLDAAQATEIAPTLRALRLARDAKGISADDKLRLRRVIRRYKGLIDEISDDLADGPGA